MGYRTYIGYMPRDKYNKVKDFTMQQHFEHYHPGKPFDMGDLYVGIYDIVKELHGFGKYVDNFPKKLFRPFFKNKELHKYYTTDDDCYLVGKKFLESFIERYRQSITDYYNEMASPFFGDGFKASPFLNTVKRDYLGAARENLSFDWSKITQEEVNAFNKMADHVKSMRAEWTHLNPLNLHKGEEITKSWKYEYAIFELVRIYKSFDWRNNVMVYYGY